MYNIAIIGAGKRVAGVAERYLADDEFVLKAVCDVVHRVSNAYVFVDNCYGELCEELEPTAVGADIAVGSLIKNMGAGIAESGGYIVGTREAVEKCANL